MNDMKILEDWLFKAYLEFHQMVPSGLVELQRYFRNFGSIEFEFHDEGGLIVAVSKNFRYGSIVTFATDEIQLEEKIKDAILTSFGIPSSYSKEAAIHRVGNEQIAYAAA